MNERRIDIVDNKAVKATAIEILNEMLRGGSYYNGGFLKRIAKNIIKELNERGITSSHLKKLQASIDISLDVINNIAPWGGSIYYERKVKFEIYGIGYTYTEIIKN